MPGFGRLGGGFGRLGTSGKSGVPTLPLVLPASPTAVYSAAKVSGWAGNCLQVRDNGGTTHDIGFGTNNYVDKAALNALTGPLTITKIYDQSGNGNDLTQATVANQPESSSLNEWNSIRPFSFAGQGTVRSQYMALPSLGLSRTNFTAYMSVAPRTARLTNMFWEFNDGVSAVDLNFSSDSSGLQTTGPATTVFSTGDSATWPRFETTNVHFVSNASNQIVWNRGHKQTGTVSTSKTMAGGYVGTTITATTANAIADFFFLAFYPSAHSDSTVQATDALLVRAFSEPTSFTYLLDYNGSSLIGPSEHSTHNQTVPWIQQWPSNWEIYVQAIGGTQLGTQYSNRNSVDIALVTAGRTKNIAVIDAPSNDINAQTSFANQAAAETYATNLYNNTTLAYVSALKAGGFDIVVVPTTIARGAFNTSTNNLEYARLKYNALVVAGWASGGYVLADRAGDSRLNDATNTTYFYTDQIHPVDAGYAILAPIDKAAILSGIEVDVTAALTATATITASLTGGTAPGLDVPSFLVNVSKQPYLM